MLNPSPPAKPLLHIAISESSRRPFVLQMLSLVAEAAQIEWHIHDVPWARVLLMAERGQALAFGVSRSASREPLFEFSEPIFENHAWMVVRRDQKLDYRGLSDFAGRVLCVTRGISYGPEFDDAKGRLFRVEAADGDLATKVRMLMAGRCDVMLTSHRSAKPWAVEQALRKASGHSAALAVVARPLLVDPVHFAVARGHALAQMLPHLNAAMRQQAKAMRALVDSEI